MRVYFLTICSLVFLFSCQDNKATLKDHVGFEKIPPEYSGLNFSNDLEYSKEFNIYSYRNFYNGGGVAIGDINGDTLPDLYFTLNMGKNKLMLNKGDMKFEDITDIANVGGTKAWSTGVSFADVNGDGLLDIYVCNSGDVNGDNKQNELFINKGNLKFEEKAEEYGINDSGYSTHAVFFDYDKDGDLDLYLLNNSYQAIGSFNLKNNMRNIRDEAGGDKLMRNEGNHFVDVSDEAGIFGSVIGFGLGVTVGDINDDSWPDIYVSNDFFERDYIYINNKNGTFKEDLPDRMKSISAASMGADMADINNDAYPDIFVTEMLPNQDRRIKTKTTFEDWDKYSLNLKYDYYHQFTRNMLQLGRRDKTFAEVGRKMGVSATDWSWGALIADFDNDSWKDLFIANGIARDLTDQDFLNYVTDEKVVQSMIKDNVVDYQKLIDVIPSEPLPNFLYHNEKGHSFINVASDWGISEPSFSNGSAYGDLDLDGDLDLVVNNVNMQPFLFENKTSGNNWLQFVLEGKDKNTQALGTKIYCYSDSLKQYLEYMPIKGFQSSMDYVAHLGLGNSKVDSIIIVWPDLKMTQINKPEINKRHYIKWSDASHIYVDSSQKKNNLIEDITAELIDYRHIENDYVDFDRERLLYQMRSTSGPKTAIGDVNNDKLDDIIICGASGQATGVLLQNANGTFVQKVSDDLLNDKDAEDLDVELFDLDGDNDLDIYIARGGSEFNSISSSIKDDIYLNDGDGSFSLLKDRFPTSGFSLNQSVDSKDIDQDGDLDLLIAENTKSGAYGVPGNLTVLINNEGILESPSQDKISDLQSVGLVKDAKWIDFNQDGLMDIIAVGEYMAPELFLNENGSWKRHSEDWGVSTKQGWWNTIEIGDFNNDGLLDFVVGNHGLNSRFKSNDSQPVCMHINDFDRNGSVEQIICVPEGDKSYPVSLRHDLVKQLPFLKKRFVKYDDYANKTIEDIFTEEELKGTITLKANSFESAVFLNQNGSFKFIPLPDIAQFSPVYALKAIDINNDGNLDLLGGGNLYAVKPEIGRYDASQGFLLLGNGDGTFQDVQDNLGFVVDGEIRDLKLLNSVKFGKVIVVARNNEALQFYKIN